MLGTLGLTARAVGSFCGYGNVYLVQREPVARGVHLAWETHRHEAVRGNNLEAVCTTGFAGEIWDRVSLSCESTQG